MDYAMSILSILLLVLLVFLELAIIADVARADHALKRRGRPRVRRTA